MPIRETETGWILETATTGYAFGVDASGHLAHRYWGPRLPYADDYPAPPQRRNWEWPFAGAAHLTLEEYPAYGGMSYVEPCLKVTFADGTRDTVLRFESALIGASEDGTDDARQLSIVLRDAVYPLRVTLSYHVHEEYDLIERSVSLTNEGADPITVERVWSAQWHLPTGDAYRMTHLAGRWGEETQLQRAPLTRGVTVLESRRLTTSHHHAPWFAIDACDAPAQEDVGSVWYGALAWSGNWKLAAEVTDSASTRVNIGLNDWDFAWRLDFGQTFATPSAYAGYSADGFGGASRRLHHFVRERVVPHPQVTRKVLYNSWEATLFDVEGSSQKRLAEIAAGIGVELFVLDDGWFRGRNDDHAALGDWTPDPKKFPDGLGPLIAHVNALGMDFGLWVEPEMVNPNSDLYRAHPDWVIHFPRRERTEGRNQLILNVARTDVQDNLIETLDRLLGDHNIAFIKWDMNRNVSEPGWPNAPGDQRELWVRYVQGLYRVWETLRARHPDVIWQSCSGGGGRADLGILRLADQIWISDNTDATARLRIQEGFSQMFPAATMEAWVTDAAQERLPLAFRFHVSMCGALGVGANLLHWSDEERAEAARWIALYKALRPIIHGGDQYRLRSASEHAFSAVQYVSPDRSEGALFAFRTHLPGLPWPWALPPLRLRGLDPQARYTVEGIADARSGAAWMHDGFQLLLGDFESTVRRISRVSNA